MDAGRAAQGGPGEINLFEEKSETIHPITNQPYLVASSSVNASSSSRLVKNKTDPRKHAKPHETDALVLLFSVISWIVVAVSIAALQFFGNLPELTFHISYSFDQA
jgi:hypothetical protein